MQMKPRLIAILDHVHQIERDYARSLDDEKRNQTGTLEDWSYKDLIGHLAAWEERHELIYTGQADANMDVDAQNALFFEEFRDVSFVEVFERLSRAQRDVMRQLVNLTEEQLLNPHAESWTEGRPMWRWIAGTSYIHPIMHLSQFLVEHGQKQQGLELIEQAVEEGSALDESGQWRGTLRYNQACVYAWAGEKARGIAALSEALQLNPNLRGWSLEDKDLDPLRGEPGYEEIFAAA